MYKSYRKDVINKQGMRFKGYNRDSILGGKRSKRGVYKTILRQLLISIIIITVIILIKSINTPVTNTISMSIKTSIVKEFDYKNSVKNVVKYASNIKEGTIKITETIPVFNDQSSEFKFGIPIEGRIASTYGEKYDPITEKATFQRGIDIQLVEDKFVKSIEEGVVDTIGESETLGKFIKIRHNEKIFSLYSNLDDINVNEEQIIKRGERIGEIENQENQHLHFELWIDDEAVDPQLYLEYDRINI